MTSAPPTNRPLTLAAKPRELTPLDPATVTLSVLIPVYNELNTIETILDRVHATPVRKEIICVDDCSTDGTRERLVALHEAGYIDRLVLQPQNGGKGKAIRTALAASTGDVVIVQDADLEYDPQDWPVLLEPIVAGKADYWYRVNLPNGESGWVFGGLLLDYNSRPREELHSDVARVVGTGAHDRECRGDEGIGWHEYFVTVGDADRAQDHLKRVGAVGDTNAVLHAGKLREFSLKAGDFFTKDERRILKQAREPLL